MANLESEEYVRPPITVHVSMSYKINTGNYESLGINIGITDTQQPDEGPREAHERVFNFVNRRLQEKVQAVKGELAEQGTGGGY